MRKLAIGLGLVVAMFLFVAVRAEEDKEETLKGNITCAKCELKVKDQKTCATVVVVKKDDKDTVYYFDKAGHKKYHDDICKKGKTGTVKGTVKKEGEKMVVTVKELKYDE
jgi:hypothetical protein